MGFNIILHGRNPIKLENARKSLLAEYPEREVRIVVADASASGLKLLENVKWIVERIKDVHLTVLVNNVGGPPPKTESLYKNFAEYGSEEIDGYIAMNVGFTTHITRSILPLLLSHGKPSLIINIGSMSDIGMPRLSMYSGTKAFLMSWTTAVAIELRGEGKDVEVLGIIPGKSQTLALGRRRLI